MEKGYRTLAGHGRIELVTKKSRFIGTACPAEDEKTAVSIVDAVRREFRDASHNVYAFVLGADSELTRSSDDGEPSGTAGRPVLEVIQREQVRNAVVVVTRYFGGVLLGASGLVRAYASCARDALHKAGIVERRPFVEIGFYIDYPALGRVQSAISDMGCDIIGIEYAERVRLSVSVPEQSSAAFCAAMKDLLLGKFDPSILPPVMKDYAP